MALSSLLGTSRDGAGGLGAICRGPQEPAAPILPHTGPSRVADAALSLLHRGPPYWLDLRAAELSGEAGLL